MVEVEVEVGVGVEDGRGCAAQDEVEVEIGVEVEGEVVVGVDFRGYLRLDGGAGHSVRESDYLRARLEKFKVKPRIYIDTSVFGGFFDEEFSEHTIPLFERIQEGEFIVLYSTVTQDELEYAPENVKGLVQSLKVDLTEFIGIADEVVELASEYISEKVVGQTSYVDCLHIALATINRADFLVSWNFKHIVNMERIRGYNSINIKYGYKQLEIRSPREFERYDEEE